jgi:hypothetical protein
MATGSIRFEHDDANDVYIVYPRWTIESEDDCKAWLQQYVEFFEKLGRRVDAVFVLDDFKIGKDIGCLWGAYRAEVHKRFTRHTIRVHSNAKVLTSVSTSGVLHGVATDEARDLDTALRLIELKRQDGV